MIAANAPRDLVRAYRQSEMEYKNYRATLSPDKAALMPETIFRTAPEYRARFFEIMGLTAPDPSSPHPASAPASAPTSGAHGPITPESVERMYQAQLVWDSAMAESIATHRKQHPKQKVLHIVGAFHVEHAGGTLHALYSRRPKDRVLVLVYHGAEIGELPDKPQSRATNVEMMAMTTSEIRIRGVRPKQEQ